MWLTLTGELDLYSAPQLTREIAAVLAGGERSLVIGIDDLEFVDSSGLRAMLMARNDTIDLGGSSLSITRGSPSVQHVLVLSGLDAVFDVVRSS